MGSRTRGRPPTRWIDDVENDLKTLNIKNWQRVAAYRCNWRKRTVEAAKTCNSLTLGTILNSKTYLIIENHLASVGASCDDSARTPIARSAPRLFTSTTPGGLYEDY
ncbi:hypothetical protein TNCV_1545651 [Trichonephila clavipes]|nr:hypothetical protein TNCV_1545651 [Trichonephila clavipes]